MNRQRCTYFYSKHYKYSLFLSGKMGFLVVKNIVLRIRQIFSHILLILMEK